MSKTYVNLSYQADISDLRKELAKIPGITESEAMAAVKQLNSSFKKAETQAKKMNDEMKDSKARLLDIKKGAAAAFGGGVNDVEDYIAALGSMGPVALGVVASLAAIAGAATVTVASLYAVVEVTRAGEEAMKRLQEISNLELVSEEDAKNIEEANAALDALGIVADQVTVALAAGLGPAVKQGSMLLLDLIFAAEDLWKSLDNGKTTIVSYGKSVAQFWADTLTTPIRLIQYFITANAKVADALGMHDTAFQKLDKTYGIGVVDIGKYISAQLGAILTTDEHSDKTLALFNAKKKDSKATKDQTSQEKDHTAELEKIKDIQDSLLKQSEELVAANGSETDQIKYKAKVEKEAIKEKLKQLKELGATEEVMAASRKAAAESFLEIEEKSSTSIAAINEKLTEKRKKQIEDIRAANKASHDEDMANRKVSLDDIKDFIQQVSDSYAAIADIVNNQNDIAGEHHKKKLERIRDEKKQTTKSYKDALKDYKAHESKMTDREREAALASLAVLKAGTKAKIDSLNGEAAAEKAALMKAWKTKKALAYGQIAINTALAITSAIAQFGPPPNPVAIAAMVAATAIGVGSAIAVASEPTPKFHTGRSPQELPAILDRGEAVLNRRGAHTMGKEAIEAANNGTSAPMMGGMGDVVIALNSRVIDTLSSEAVRRGPKTRLMIRQFQKQSSGRGGYR